MTIYIEYLFILNYIFDFFILLTVNVTLKRNIKLKRLFLSSLTGELSILLFFIKNDYLFIILKIILAVIMVIVTFHYKDIIYTISNLSYFYMCNIILGGFIYYLKYNELSYLFILGISPIILGLYYYQSRELKSSVNETYPVTFYFNNKRKIDCIGFLDTGNRLRDPISKKYVVLINKKLLKGIVSIKYPYYVPYKSLNNEGVVECIKLNKMVINGINYTNLLIGLMDEAICINQADCILNYCLWEEKYV